MESGHHAHTPAPCSRATQPQPLEVVHVDGALLRLTTVAAVAGQSLPTIYHAARAGKLTLTKVGQRSTRVRSEHLREYLDALSGN